MRTKKPLSPRKFGKIAEDLIYKKYEAQGCLVEKNPWLRFPMLKMYVDEDGQTKKKRSQDIFGVGDLLVITPQHEKIMIQVKHGKSYFKKNGEPYIEPHLIDLYQAFVGKFWSPDRFIVVIVRDDLKEFEIPIVDVNGL